MNIIILVVTMLMVMASLTYAKLESTRSFAGMKTAYHHFMKNGEIGRNRAAAEMWYGKIKIKKQEGSLDKTRAEGLSRLSVYELVNKGQERSSETYKLKKEMFKLLMLYLYKDQPFFKEMAEKNPLFIDDLITQIEIQTDALAANEKITRIGQLANLNLSPVSIQHVLVLMLNGKQSAKPVEQNEITNKEDQDNEDIQKMESNETFSKPGYVSLENSISFQNSNKIRVFLASKTILNIIYEETGIVEKILERRRALYLDVKSEKIKESEATQIFTNEFSHLGQAEHFAPILSFSVTKSNPKNYE